ncbi:MAG: phospholipid/cholesterol/gamma-HCH transport system substrate-binding protein [Thermoleophilaceae bacterium]|jgi:phospholipid/cholesterol/gamma-HCH transport system substrate-binding protein|nr:phospholipid/cholesterol/gamma-HCH transport system substrate-binding protein [Thermoleophilaceae bacterium]
MQKEGPSFGRIAAMVIFALSCFGLLTFLWISFGGSVPLKPKQYELTINFPEATTIAEAADVRIAGVTVGKVRSKRLDKSANRTKVVLRIDPKYAPLPRDTRAILRQKTLLGETFVELSPGTKGSGRLADGGTLANSQVEPTVELDEILRIFDPATKTAFRSWVQESAKTISGTAPEDLNSALGNLAGFAQDGASVLQVLDTQSTAVRRLIKNTGVVFGALNARKGQLHDLILNSDRTFSALQSEQAALADTFRVFPTFLDESKVTLARLQDFSVKTRPLVNDLKPVADDLGPTVRDLGALAPDLETFFRRLPPVIRSSKTDLPAAADFLRGARPVFQGLHVFLPQLNPILSYWNFDQDRIAHFLSAGGAAFHYNVAPQPGGLPGYALAQFGVVNGESIQLRDKRPSFERANSYLAPNAYNRGPLLGMFESFDCKPSGGEVKNPSDDGSAQIPPCFVQPRSLYDNKYFPNLDPGNVYLKPSPRGTTAGTEPANPNR